MSVPSHLPSRRGLVSLVLWKILGSCRDTPCVWTWIHDLLGTIHIFLSGGPKVVQPINSLKIHPIAIFWPLTELGLLYLLGFLKQAGGSHLVVLSLSLECPLTQLTTVRHSALSGTLLLPAFSWSVPLWPRDVFAKLGNYREMHGPDSGI